MSMETPPFSPLAWLRCVLRGRHVWGFHCWSIIPGEHCVTCASCGAFRGAMLWSTEPTGGLPVPMAFEEET